MIYLYIPSTRSRVPNLCTRSDRAGWKRLHNIYSMKYEITSFHVRGVETLAGVGEGVPLREFLKT